MLGAERKKSRPDQGWGWDKYIPPLGFGGETGRNGESGVE